MYFTIDPKFTVFPNIYVLVYNNTVICSRPLSSAALAYMAEVAYAAGPALQGPRASGQNKIIVLPNCGIASWIVFTTAILHWHNSVLHTRGNILALVEYTNAADEDAFEAQGKLPSDCYDCIKEPVWGNLGQPFCIKVEATERIK